MSHPETYDMPVDIPAEKTAAREWLASLMKGATVTHCPTKPQPEPKPWKPRERNSAANDNEPAIPVCEALIRDKRPDDAAMVRRYIMLVDVAGLPQEDVQAEVGHQGIDIARRRSFDDNGRMRDHGMRESKKVAISRGVRTTITSDDVPSRAQAPAVPTIGEDSLIAHMDAKAILGPLRAALGPLLDVFELAALSGLTMTQIGELRGLKGKPASGAGKMVVYMAIDTLRDAWNRDNRLAAVQARQAHAAVRKAGDKRNALNLIYFGKDINKRPGTIYGRSKAA
ncbi:hypothetical protein [Brucella intermedia]|uniref:hypothetical protein n=1 Tax=Brucella intermedia TaxID=94625 RepID=UPI00124DA0B3|nr:hypothetical protein [Brucella intermedia]KAB2729387.1 hypothetical protein F9L02_14695 [Brucella intermedia]